MPERRDELLSQPAGWDGFARWPEKFADWSGGL